MADFILLGSMGAVAGLLAGLFGIGGGIIIVPALIFSFEMDGMGQYATKLAIGTSLASILFMGLSSSFAHYKREAIEWESLFCLAPFIIVGTAIGSQIAGRVDGFLLKRLFGILMLTVAMTMLFRISEKEAPHASEDRVLSVRKWMIYAVGGILIGTISSLFGTGGGTMTVPFLVLLLDKPIRVAIGTASATGVIIAFFGTIGFIYQGWRFLPNMRFGFVAPQTALLIAACGCMTAPLGALIAHRIDTLLLSRVFSVFLIIVSFLLIF
ncbi:MAG: sulfite exporter TauE/SafE family protein [Nitrospirae bacterium]|nr:sulfite exporter TauE/SafE family protein [Candidatus Troglogloeales bacterium]